jgi:hypothetical protein
MAGTTSRIPKGKARQAARDTAPLGMLRASAPPGGASRATDTRAALRTREPVRARLCGEARRPALHERPGSRHRALRRRQRLSLHRCDRTRRHRQAGPATHSTAPQAVTRVLGEVAKRLGNTPAICRESCVHPIVMNCFLAGTLTCDGPRCAVPARRLRRLLSNRDATRSAAQDTRRRMPARRVRPQRKNQSVVIRSTRTSGVATATLP